MDIELDESIPEVIRKRSLWNLTQTARDSGEMPAFELHLTPPLPKVIEFDTPLTSRNGTETCKVIIHKEPRYISDRYGKVRTGWTLSMNGRDARLAEEFFARHK